MSLRQWLHATAAETARQFLSNRARRTARRDRRGALVHRFQAERLEPRQLLTVAPFVESINRTNPAGPTTNASSVTYTVTFSEPVTGVNASDFQLATTGTIAAASPVIVTPMDSATYTVTVSGISGSGTLGLNLINNGSIQDLSGHSLRGGFPIFQPQQTFAALGGPTSIVTADVNGDGRLDLLASTNSGPIDVLLGNGNGTFQPATTVAVGPGSSPILVADVNGDGRPDILVTGYQAHTLSVVLGNGNATFLAPKTLATGSGPLALATADLNGDRMPDIVVANRNGSSLSVFLGNGDGTFQSQRTLATQIDPSSLVAADVNGDGKTDLVVAAGGSLGILLGNGNGTFQPQYIVSPGANVGTVAVSDVNGDSKADLIALPWTGNVALVLLANGNGTFESAQSFAAGPNPSAVTAADLNGDGSPDLIVEGNSYTGGSTDVLMGNGNGSFSAPQTFAVGSYPGSAVVADLNGNGIPDAVVCNQGNNTIGLLLDNPNFVGQAYTINPPPQVLSISRLNPGGLVATGTSVTFTVTFSEPVAGVNPADFMAVTSGGDTAGTISVLGGGSSYSVTVNGIHGSGQLRLDLIDNDLITDSLNLPLGGPGAGNGSFQGQTYTIQQIYPSLTITRASPDGTITNASSVVFNLTFSEPVTGVSPSDLQVATTGTMTASLPPSLTPLSASQYTVTVNGISGTGSLGLNFIDNGTVRDINGNPLQANPQLPQAFTAQQTFNAGRYRLSAKTVDLNGDGKPDLLVNNQYSLSILLGNGNGTFQVQHTFASFGSITSFTAADVNGDGRPDLLIVDQLNETVSLLLGNGNGTFQAPQIVMAPQTWTGIPRPYAVTVGDLNGDGKPDLIISAQGQSPIVAVRLGNGNGTFQAPLTFAAALFAYSLAIADVNGDGTPDVIEASSLIGQISVLLGNGDGSLKARTAIPTGSFRQTAEVVTGDLNGDGNADLAIPNNGAAGINLLLGNGNGTFQSTTVGTAGYYGASLALADVNGDGIPDLIAEGSDSDTRILLSNGNGTFTPASTIASRAGAFAVADVNGDGRPDIVDVGANTTLLGSGTTTVGPTYLYPPHVLSINRATPTGWYTSASSLSYTVSFTEPVTGVTAADFRIATTGSLAVAPTVVVTPVSGSVYTVAVNGVHGSGTVELDLIDNDSIVDSVLTPLGGSGFGNGSFKGQVYNVLQAAPRVLSINRTSPSGTGTTATAVGYAVAFSEPVTGVDSSDFQVVTTGSLTTALPVIVTPVSGSVYTVSVVGISGIGTLGLNLVDNGTIHDAAGNPLVRANAAASFITEPGLNIGKTPSGISTADMNSDGKSDLLFLNLNGAALNVLLGNGDGTFASAITVGVGPSAVAFAVGDVNGDGIPDLVVANFGGNNVGVLLGNGNGTFQSQTTFATDRGPDSVALADINGDGKIDLVVANATSGSISVLRGNGDGTFQPQQTIAIARGIQSILAVDLNADGLTDLIVDSPTTNSLDVLLGNGDGTFHSPQTLGTGLTPYATAVADVNGDGNPDLIVTNYNGSSVSILLGNGNGTFQPQVTVFAGKTPAAITTGDVNGDGNADLVLTNAAYGTLTTLLGNGNGTFQPAQSIATSTGPDSISISDFNADGKADLVVASAAGTIQVFEGNATGSFTGQVYGVGPRVLSIVRTSPAGPVTGASTSSYTVTFSAPISGVDPSDFKVIAGGGVAGPSSITVSPTSQSAYTVSLNGVHGSGTIQLDLIDDDSITFGGIPLGGPGIDNGSFAGQSYTIAQVYPSVLSINRTLPAGVTTPGGTVSYTVAFSTSVTNVDASDFRVVTTGSTVASPAVIVTPVSGSVYTVTISGVSGEGTLNLELIDNGRIRDSVGNPLVHPGVSPNFSSTALTGAFPPDLNLALIGSPGSGEFLADVNGDGQPDAISGHALYLGNGDGTFQPARTLSFAGGVVGVADVNGDGRADLIVGQGGNDAILLGNGDGTFEPALTFGAGLRLSALAEADINGDGKTDLVAFNQYFGNNGAIVELLGNGDGTFQAPRVVTLLRSVQNIVVADVNGDGRPDIFANSYNSIDLLLGNGDGSFGPPRTVASGSLRPGFSVADLNGDGKLDLLLPFYQAQFVTGGHFAVLNGNGNGTFQSPQPISTDIRPDLAAIGDFTGDGRPDVFLAYLGVNGPLFRLLTNSTKGGFLSQPYEVQPPSPTRLLSIERSVPAGPATNASSVSYTVTFSGPVSGVLSGDFQVVASGSVRVANPLSVTPVNNSAYTVTISGIRGEGTIGLNFIDNGTVRDLAGRSLLRGLTSFGPEQTISTTADHVFVADLNNDGTPDLVTSNLTSDTTSALLGNGNGTFQSFGTVAVNTVTLAVADVNADGIPDLVASTGSYSGTLELLLGNGNGTFQPPQTVASVTALEQITVADLNLDGKPDLVVTEGGSSYEMAIFLGNGNGTFLPPQTYSTINPGQFMAVADVNNDGRPDVVTDFNGILTVWLGDGSGGLSQLPAFDTHGTSGFFLSDLNNDGRDDLVVTSYNADYVLLGNGDGTFGPQLPIAQTSDTVIGIGDLNSDGKPDLIASAFSQSSLEILQGNGDGTFGPPEVFLTSQYIGAATVIDLNNDGKPDLLLQQGLISGAGVSLNSSDDSFTGPTYTIEQIYPHVVSIAAGAPQPSPSVLQFNVTFSEPVTGVDPTDFQVATGGSAAFGGISVTPVSGSLYTVDVTGVSGIGTVGLNLVDDGTIRDANGNPLLQSVSGNAFAGQQQYASFPQATSISVADLNGD